MDLMKFKSKEPIVRVIQPLVNIKETDKEVVLEAEMVGLSKEDINLELKNEELIISGKSRPEDPPKGYTSFYCERCPLEYTRSFMLGDNIDKGKIEAEYEQGVLKVILQKTETAHPKKIEIKG